MPSPINRTRLAYVAAAFLPLTLLLSILSWFAGDAAAQDPEPPKILRIGLLGSLFRGIPEPLIKVSLVPFRALVKAETGLNGELITVEDSDKLGEQLTTDKLQLGVFHGFEFGWAREKYAGLVPLVVVVNQQQHLHAHVMVRQDSEAGCLADLGGKSLALSRGSMEHCRLFVERKCQAANKDWKLYFSQITNPANGEDALDDVVDGVAAATVVDGLCLQCYKRRKPGRFEKLKEVHKSEVFPTAVVAYHAGALDEASLRCFREGMIGASERPGGRRLMTLWRITGFEKVPDDYEQTLTDIIKAYPRPQPPAEKSTTTARVKPKSASQEPGFRSQN